MRQWSRVTRRVPAKPDPLFFEGLFCLATARLPSLSVPTPLVLLSRLHSTHSTYCQRHGRERRQSPGASTQVGRVHREVRLLLEVRSSRNSCTFRIHYSERYSDEEYEYRHVILPKPLFKMIPKHFFNQDNTGTLRLLSEEEWRGIGITQSLGWEHYEVHGKSSA